MSHSLHWWREKGVLHTQVSPYGIYTIRKHSRGVRRVYLNSDGTTYYGSEAECQKAVQRIVESMILGKEQRAGQ